MENENRSFEEELKYIKGILSDSDGTIPVLFFSSVDMELCRISEILTRSRNRNDVFGIDQHKPNGERLLGRLFTLHSVFFVDSYTGFVAGYASTLLKTTDGGNNWFNPSDNQEQGFYSSVYFTNRNTGYVLENKSYPREGIVLKTEDGGKTWTKQYGAIGYNFNSLFFLDDTTGIAVGNGSVGGTILKSYLGSNNWIDQPSGVYDELNAVYIKKNKGYSVGNNGIILRIELGPDSIDSIEFTAAASACRPSPKRSMNSC